MLEKNDLFDVLMFWVYRLCLRAGEVAIDGGANQGMHTKILSDSVGVNGMVYAFEPIPLFYHRLRTRFEKVPNVRVLPTALASSSGTAQFFVNTLNASYCSGLKNQDKFSGGKSFPLIVKTLSLDSLEMDGRSVRLLKLDLEGAELLGLRGATDLIARDRPVCVFEWGDAVSSAYAHTSDEMYNFWNERRYTLLDVRGRQLASSADFCRSSAGQEVWNYVAMPDERPAEVVHITTALTQLWRGIVADEKGRSYRSHITLLANRSKSITFNSAYDAVPLALRIANRSNFAWINLRDRLYSDVPSREEYATNVKLGIRWCLRSGRQVAEDRRELPVAALFPQESIELSIAFFPFTEYAYLEPGEYRVTVGLVHEHVTWFGTTGDHEEVFPIVVPSLAALG